MSLQALCTVAISPTLDSRAYQCRTHSEAHKVLLRQYRRWCATCFGRRTWWQRYGSVSPHLDLNILFVETYQITFIWYFHTRPLQSLNSEPVNISGRSQASLVFSDLYLFSFWGHSLSLPMPLIQETWHNAHGLYWLRANPWLRASVGWNTSCLQSVEYNGHLYRKRRWSLYDKYACIHIIQCCYSFTGSKVSITD